LPGRDLNSVSPWETYDARNPQAGSGVAFNVKLVKSIWKEIRPGPEQVTKKKPNKAKEKLKPKQLKEVG